MHESLVRNTVRVIWKKFSGKNIGNTSRANIRNSALLTPIFFHFAMSALGRREFKKGIDTDSRTVRRYDEIESLRKQKRQDDQSKRRLIGDSQVGSTDPAQAFNAHEVVTQISTNDPLSALVQLRIRLSDDHNPFQDYELLVPSALPAITHHLTQPASPEILHETLWVIANLAVAPKHIVNQMMTSDMLPALLHVFGRLLLDKSTLGQLHQTCIWALSNLAGDSDFARGILMGQNLLPGLLQFLETDWEGADQTLCAIHNLCRSCPHFEFEQYLPVLPSLLRYCNHPDIKLAREAWFALVKIATDPTDDNVRIDYLVKHTPLFHQVAEFAKNPQLPLEVKFPIVSIIGVLASGNNAHSALVIDFGMLSSLMQIVGQHGDQPVLLKNVAFALSNLAAVDASFTQLLLDANVMPFLSHSIRVGTYSLQKESAFALSNILINCTLAQFGVVKQFDFIPGLCELLKAQDVSLQRTILQALENALSFGQREKLFSGKNNQVAECIEVCGGLDKIEALQMSDNTSVAQLASQINLSYFVDDDETPVFDDDGYDSDGPRQYHF